MSLAAALRTSPRLVARSYAAPIVPLDAARAVLPGEAGFLWAPPDGPAMCGAGVAERLEARGAGRFEAVAEAAGKLYARIDGEAPRLFGGLAFAPGAADAAPWSEFGDASFVLPRWTYVVDGGQARLVFCGHDAEDPARILAALERAVVPDGALPLATGESGEDEAGFVARLAEVLAALADGRAEKIVAARRLDMAFAGELDPALVLARLRAEAAGAWRFGFWRGKVAFVGASPERLVRREGLHVASEALAGTVARHLKGELLASVKDRAEHDPVVRSIVAALAPLCAELRVPPRPELRELPHVVHLATPVHGRLKTPAHLLALAAALHPTPAVAGLPRAAAGEWIAARETARGWYAGPVGWFDASGDGELVVALRSGVVAGPSAHLFAGAGIVAGSQPEREWQETELKLRTLRRALGVSA